MINASISALAADPRCAFLYLGCLADTASRADQKIADGDRCLLALIVGLEEAMVSFGFLKDRTTRPVYVSTGRPRGRPRHDTPEPLLELRERDWR